jgi:thermitase
MRALSPAQLGALLFAAALSGVACAEALAPAEPLRPVPIVEQAAPDPDLARSWHLSAIGADRAWRHTRGDRRIKIAVIDSGIAYNHPELAAAIARKEREWPLDGIDSDGNGFRDDFIGWDFLRNTNLPHDPNGHGTFIAGLIASVADNGIGSAGVCPGCSILPIRFSNRDGEGDIEDAIRGIDYAIREGASVINYSFAGEGADSDLKDAIRRAGDHDILVVVAAGNDAENIDRSSTYPAKYQLPNLITVAATDEGGALAEMSSWGKRTVHLGAPGIGLIAPWSDGTIWDEGEGTSYATPIVAAVAGLVRSAAPQLKATEVKQVLMATARRTPKLEGKLISGGVVDAAAALECATSPALPCLKASFQIFD